MVNEQPTSFSTSTCGVVRLDMLALNCSFFQIISCIPCHFLYLHLSSHLLTLLVKSMLMALLLSVVNKIIKAGINVKLVNVEDYHPERWKHTKRDCEK